MSEDVRQATYRISSARGTDGRAKWHWRVTTPDWTHDIRRDAQGGLVVAGVDHSRLRLSLSGSRHLALRIGEAGEYRAGIVLDRDRVEWLRQVLGGWLKSGGLDGEGEG